VLDGVGGQRHAPSALPPGKTRHPLYKTLGGPQSRSGQVQKILPPPGFDPRTVHPVTSRANEEVHILTTVFKRLPLTFQTKIDTNLI